MKGLTFDCRDRFRLSWFFGSRNTGARGLFSLFPFFFFFLFLLTNEM